MNIYSSLYIYPYVGSRVQPKMAFYELIVGRDMTSQHRPDVKSDDDPLDEWRISHELIEYTTHFLDRNYNIRAIICGTDTVALHLWYIPPSTSSVLFVDPLLVRPGAGTVEPIQGWRISPNDHFHHPNCMPISIIRLR